MKVVADENIPGLDSLPAEVSLERLPGRLLGRAQLDDARALLVRSVTPVGAALLQGSPVGFVGTATIGTDHLHQEWLDQAGIRYVHAPGCNAMAVAEYVLQAALAWAGDRGRSLAGMTVGVVGAGNVGARLGWLMEALGCELMLCDPPRQRAGERAPVGRWCDLHTALGCQVVSLHVPLVRQGSAPTFHLLGRDQLAAMSAGQLLVNTCRGEVVDNAALVQRLEQGDGPQVVLDVWEGEPVPDAGLFALVRAGTPHVAGYSLEGKLRGTRAVLEGLAEWAGWAWRPPATPMPRRRYEGGVVSESDLLALLQSAYPMARDHEALDGALAGADTGLAFDRLRREYPVRHEVAGIEVLGPVDSRLAPVLRRLGVGWGTEPASSDPAAQWLAESCAR